MTAPVLERLTNDIGLNLYVLDVDANPLAWQLFSIQGTPSVMRFEGGQEVERLAGANSEEDWLALLQRGLAAEKNHAESTSD